MRDTVRRHDEAVDRSSALVEGYVAEAGDLVQRLQVAAERARVAEEVS